MEVGLKVKYNRFISSHSIHVADQDTYAFKHRYIFLSSPKDIFSLLIEREEGGDSKKYLCVRETSLVVSLYTP